MLKEVDGFQNWLKEQNSTYATVTIDLHTNFPLGARGHNIVTTPDWHLSDTTSSNTTTGRTVEMMRGCVVLLDTDYLR